MNDYREMIEPNIQLSTISTIQPLAVNAKQAAKMLGIGRTTLYHLVKAGKLSCKKLDRATLYSIEDLKAFLKSANSKGETNGKSF